MKNKSRSGAGKCFMYYFIISITTSPVMQWHWMKSRRKNWLNCLQLIQSIGPTSDVKKMGILVSILCTFYELAKKKTLFLYNVTRGCWKWKISTRRKATDSETSQIKTKGRMDAKVSVRIKLNLYISWFCQRIIQNLKLVNENASICTMAALK